MSVNQILIVIALFFSFCSPSFAYTKPIDLKSTSGKHEQAVSSATDKSVSPININKATLDELTHIKGIGQKKAQAIISYRETNGKFSSIDDLAKVKGIGEKKAKAIEGSISF